MGKNRATHPVAIPAASAPVVPHRSVSAVSLNLARATDAGEVVETISDTSRLRDADVFLFQEVTSGKQTSSIADEIASRLGYFSAFEASPSADDQGLALVTRYPVADVQISPLKACNLRFRNRNRFALMATLRTPWGDLRAWNVHLDTRVNATERVDQLRPVIDEASRYAGPQLIGGDFNTNDLRWVRNVLPMPGGPSHGATIRTVMTEHGFETPFSGDLSTFPALRRQLDWIFVRGMMPLESSVELVPFSDHNAIWVRLHL
jgi:endonuclease/exonuclease/phosphatase family metal-dependent hydrolase